MRSSCCGTEPLICLPAEPPCQTFGAKWCVREFGRVRRVACPRPDSSRVLHAGRHPGAAREVGLPQRPLAAPSAAKTAPAAYQPSAWHQCRPGGLEDATGSAGRIYATTCSHDHRCVFKRTLFSSCYKYYNNVSHAMFLLTMA